MSKLELAVAETEYIGFYEGFVATELDFVYVNPQTNEIAVLRDDYTHVITTA